MSIKRDPINRPRLLKSTSAPSVATPKLMSSAVDGGTAVIKAWVAPSPRVEANRLLRAASNEALRCRVQEIGESLVVRGGKPSAAQRKAWLIDRVRAKSSQVA